MTLLNTQGEGWGELYLTTLWSLGVCFFLVNTQGGGLYLPILPPGVCVTTDPWVGRGFAPIHFTCTSWYMYLTRHYQIHWEEGCTYPFYHLGFVSLDTWLKFLLVCPHHCVQQHPGIHAVLLTLEALGRSLSV